MEAHAPSSLGTQDGIQRGHKIMQAFVKTANKKKYFDTLRVYGGGINDIHDYFLSEISSQRSKH